MNKKNIYFRTHLNRDPQGIKFFRTIAYIFSSGSRLLLEVLIRKNFGERYFRLKQAVGVVFMLGLYPIVKVKIVNFITLLQGGIDARMAGFTSVTGMEQFAITPETGYDNSDIQIATIFPDYAAWYLYLAVFLAFSIRHHLHQRRNSSVFDFTKYSRKSGDIHPLFFKIKIPKLATDVRFVECFLEPALFLLLGLVLWSVGQNLGVLLIFCSVVYCISYIDDYEEGDNFILDQIDRRILSEDLRRFFIEDNIDQDAAGRLKITKRKPEDADQNKELLEALEEEKEEAFEVN